MAHYEFETEWALTAPLSKVSETIAQAERYESWWPSVRRSELLTEGDEVGVGRRTSFTIRSRLYYQMSFDMKALEIDLPNRAHYLVRGDLIGTGTYLLHQDRGNTVVRFLWQVSTTQRWMNLLAPLAKPVFVWAHGAVMREGAKAMADHLGERLLWATTRVVRRRADSVSGTRFNRAEVN